MTVPTTGFQFNNYTDPSSGTILASVWAVISEMKQSLPIPTIPVTRVDLRYDIYCDSDKLGSFVPLLPSKSLTVSANGDPTNWATYFADSVQQQANHAFQTQAYAALNAYLTNPSSFTNA